MLGIRRCHPHLPRGRGLLSCLRREIAPVRDRVTRRRGVQTRPRGVLSLPGAAFPDVTTEHSDVGGGTPRAVAIARGPTTAHAPVAAGSGSIGVWQRLIRGASNAVLLSFDLPVRVIAGMIA
jgi:hypothetical protein